jgi:hypothetical protein
MAPAVPLNILKYNGASFNYQMREDGKNRKRLPARLRTGYVQKIFFSLGPPRLFRQHAQRRSRIDGFDPDCGRHQI